MRSKTLKKLYIIIFVVTACALLYLLLGRGASSRERTREDFAMGSFVTQRVYGGDGEKAMREVIDAISEVENNGISYRISSSDVGRLNDAAGRGYVECSDLVYDTVKTVSELAYATDGAYDPLLGALTSEWDFDGGEHHVPSEETVSDLLEYCDWRDISFDDGSRSIMLMRAGNMLDLGGVGKGLACDVASGVLSEHGCTGAVVAVGGSICVYGDKPDGSGWKVAVRDPFGAAEEYIGTLTLAGGSFVSTSGDYEKGFELDGKYYHHILDSHTGYPVENELTSVTVVCGSGAMSDALSTACFVMGYEKSVPVLKKYDAEALFIYKDGTMKQTDGLVFYSASE